MFVVGLTGGIGSGKTAVSRRFEALGVPVVDADVVARQVVEPGSPALERIREHFSEGVLTADGQLDRAALRRQVFARPEDRAWLEALLHPLIGQRMQEELDRADGPYALLVSPLLVERGSRDLCHRVLVVDVPEALQLQRTMARDGSDAQTIERIMAAQASREQRLAVADDLIDNRGDEASLTAQVNALHRQYLRCAAAHPPNP